MDTPEFDWSAPGIAPSVASEVRGVLDQLKLAKSEDDAIDATYALHELICYAAVTVEEVTVPAVAALYEMLAVENFAWRNFVLQILDTVVSVDGVLGSSTPLKSRVLRSVLAGTSLVQGLESSSSRDVRGAAILLLANLSRRPAEDFNRFSQACASDQDPVVQADLALAATVCIRRADGAIGESATARWAEYALTHTNPAVRFRVGQELADHGFPAGGIDAGAVVDEAQPLVLSRRLFRMEYI